MKLRQNAQMLNMEELIASIPKNLRIDRHLNVVYRKLTWIIENQKNWQRKQFLKKDSG